MNTQNVNVKTATKESSERWVKKVSRIIDQGHLEVACAVEAHAHYGEKLSRINSCRYFFRGMKSAICKK